MRSTGSRSRAERRGICIGSHSSLSLSRQMHVIPADKDVASRLRKLRPGQIVTASGYLVDVRGPRGFAWNTSLRRDDTGNGACEILWAETLEAY